MKRVMLLFAFAIGLFLSGCLVGGPVSTQTKTSVGTQSTPAQSPDERPVEYVIRAGTIPENFTTASVTLQVVYVKQDADLGPCYADIYSGPYKPTVTPIGTPQGTCHRTSPITINLTTLNETYRIQNLSYPRKTVGHAVIVTNVTATYENGTRVASIRGAGGHIALESNNSPAGVYGIELGFKSMAAYYPYDYWITSTPFEPSG